MSVRVFASALAAAAVTVPAAAGAVVAWPFGFALTNHPGGRLSRIRVFLIKMNAFTDACKTFGR